MIVIAVVVVLGVVVVAASWARVASARAERRSVEGYGRVLDTLGDVSKRSEAGTTARSSSASELARPHVRPANGEANQAFRPASAPRDVPAPRVRLQPPVPGAPMPVFGDEAGEAASGQPAPRRSSAIGPVVSDRPEEPLTVAIPVVDPTQPVPTGAPRDAGGPSPGPLPPPAGPVYGPPLPGEALAPAGEALAPAGEAERPDDAGEAASPGLVFDAEAGLGGGEADGAPGELSLIHI